MRGGEAEMKIFQVDSFADQPFKGNPAGVCLLDQQKLDSWMQDVAMEMNLSETAFLLKNDPAYSLRWFTPKTEVSLCGHGTLASAHILWEEELVDRSAAVSFDTKSGRIVCTRAGDLIQMQFPARLLNRVAAPMALVESLGVSGEEVEVNSGVGDGEILYLVEVTSSKVLRDLTPDFVKLKDEVRRGVIVTSLSESEGVDFESRFFAPVLGIDEDPVTGSAHCYLAPYWARKLEKTTLTGYQCSSRGGVVRCEVHGDGVVIGGKAVTVMKGELLEA
jgi:PhzF family phenazine biosynthesis protein